jgi:TPR repeat protein
MRKFLAFALFAVLLLPVASLAQTAVAGTYADGLALYEDGRYVDAISALAVAGEDGDVRAQRLLGMMYLYGEQLYGSAVPRDYGMALSWLYRASAQGDPVAIRTLISARIGAVPPPSGPALVRSEASAR